MKKSVLYIALACATIFLTQCRKPAVNPAEAAFTGEKISVTMTSQSGRASRTDIDNTGKITWTAGDQLLVVSPTLGVLGKLTLTSGAGTSNGKFDGVINNWTATERLKLYYIGHYDGLAFPTEGSQIYTLDISAQSDATTPATMFDNIAKKFDILMGETHEMAPGSTVFGAVTLQPMIAIANFDTRSSSGFTNAVECRNAWNTATLNLTTGSFTSHTTNAISLGQPNNNQFVVLIPGTTTMTFHSEGATDIVVNKTIEPGAAYSDEGDPIVIAVPGALSGDFTVYKDDETARKVKFSPGNLQYRASTNTWRFAEHQYDYVGDATNGNVSEGGVKCNNASISSTYTGWIDLFGWGTSGYHQSTDANNTNYYPYSTSKEEEGPLFNTYGYGPSTNVTPEGPSGLTQTEGNISGSYYDWGVYNTIYSGGTATNGWRTLTKDEWVYLIDTRKVTVSGEQKASYGHGTVNGVKGLIILPDDWDGSVCSGFTYGDSEWSNTFSESTSPKWSEMEAVGAVFLPAAGRRDGTGVRFVGSIGRYWSGSHNYSYQAYNLNFNSGNVNPQDKNNRYFGYSVRLVR